MEKSLNLTGKRFGRLLVLEGGEVDEHRHDLWRCICDCKREIVVRGDNLRSGNTRSCGCLSKEVHTPHGGSRTRLYRIWGGMKSRCYNPKHQKYPNYGGRGITICPEWLHGFKAFQEWALSHGYRDDLTIDRIDNDKGYSPENCRWITNLEQQHNKRKSLLCERGSGTEKG